MDSYITGFSIYTLAMIGIIFVGLVVVKKCLSFGNQRGKHNYLQVESHLALEPRKNLYVIKAGNEKFLISSAGENCQFMTKLDNNSRLETQEEKITPGVSEKKILEDTIDLLKSSSIKALNKGKSRLNKYKTGIF